jgi:hypothetical protein
MQICVNTHIYKWNCDLEPHIWMHKGNVEVKFHTYAMFVWNINEWWPSLCNTACWKFLQCWSHNGLFDLLSTWEQGQNVSSCPRRKEKKQLTSALSFIAFSKMLHVLTPSVTGNYDGRDYENYHIMECYPMWSIRYFLTFQENVLDPYSS